MARAQKATDAIGQSKLQIGNLNVGVGLTTQLAHGLNDFGHAATVGRVVVGSCGDGAEIDAGGQQRRP